MTSQPSTPLSPILRIADVTLCCVDSTPRLPWALQAMQRCLAQAGFGDAILFTDAATLGSHTLPEGVRWIEISPLTSVEAYSIFMLKQLAPHIRTSHALVVQWDGYVLNAGAWNNDFLKYDYIGAPWHHIPEPHSVGNGGFSLRSKRLLDAFLDPTYVATHPEDLCICRDNRTRLEAEGIRFAPVAVARRFAVEDEPMRDDVFGFHGPYHMPLVLGPGQALAFVESLGPNAVAGHYFGSLLRETSALARADARMRPALAAFEQLILRAVDGLRGPRSLTPQALGLAKALIRHGQYRAASRLLKQRREALGRAWAEPRLRLRLNLNWLASALTAPLRSR